MSLPGIGNGTGLPTGSTNDGATSNDPQAATAWVDNTGRLTSGLNQASVSVVQFIDAADYGLSTSATASVNSAAMRAFRAAVAAATTATQGVDARIRPGMYQIDQSLGDAAKPVPNWAIKGLRLDCNNAWFVSSGNAPVLFADGGAADAVYPTSSAGVYDVHIIRARVSAPNVGTTGNAISFVKCQESKFNVVVEQTNGVGLDIGFCVLAEIDFICSANRGNFAGVIPAKGMNIRQEAIAGDWGTSSYITFNRPIIEGVGIGVDIPGGLGCTFLGGTIEGNSGVGVQTSGVSHHNRFIGVDFEANPAGDFLIGTNYIDIIACDTLNNITVNGNFVNIRGGRHNNIHLGATSNNCNVEAAYNAVDGTGVLTDLGNKNSIYLARDASTGWTGRKYSRYTPAVPASPYAYTNTTGDNQFIAFVGGVGIAMYTSMGGGVTAGGGAANGTFPLLSGQTVTLTPGQHIEVVWTTAPAQIVLWA